MPTFSYQQIRGKLTPELEQEITRFWLKEGALTNESAAKERLPQVMFIARDQNKDIAAVCSTFLQYNNQLKNHFFYFRAFIPDRFKDTDLGQQLIVHVRDLLNEDYTSGKQSQAIGLMLEVSDPQTLQRYPEAIWPVSRLVYVGKTSQGAHQRVFYFSNAQLA